MKFVSQPPSIETLDSFTVILEGKPYTAHQSHPSYAKIIAAFKSGNYQEVAALFDIKQTVQIYVSQSADITIDTEHGVLYYKGDVVHHSLVRRILTMISEGFDATPLVNFLSNLYQNPSNKAVGELYDFLEFGQMPITEDGYFIAYKRVNEDYTSCFDGITDNGMGKVVSMPRRDVDDRSHITCSNGLHICSFDYLRHFSGDRVILVKVNPADVVSIPTDYNNTKARVCQYEVIGEMTLEEAGLPASDFTASVYEYEWDDEDDEEPEVEYRDGEREEIDEILSDLLNSTDVDEDGGFDVEEVASLASDSFRDWLDVADEPAGWATADELTSDELVDYEAALNSTDLIETPQSVEVAESSYFQIGYTAGYDDGRAQNTRSVSGIVAHKLLAASTVEEFKKLNSGYQQGFKDGKGHKARLLPKKYDL